MDTETKLPEDSYSRTLSRLLDNPEAMTVNAKNIDAVTLLGHTESWIIRVVRVGAHETAFLQQINAEGGKRHVIPPAVMRTILQQHDAIASKVRKRGARAAVVTRRAKGAK